MTDFIIDGYNLLHAMGTLKSRKAPAGLEKARERLLGILKASFADDTSCLTVVFDASQAPAGIPQQTSLHGIRIHFARTEEADDAIETLIAKHSAPKNLTIVSDDHRLRRAARRRRAQSMNCPTFLTLLSERRRQARAAPPEKTDHLSPAETQQLLDEFGHLDAELKEAFEIFDFDDPDEETR